MAGTDSGFVPLANPFGMTNEAYSKETGIPMAWVGACVGTISVGAAASACMVAATIVPTSSTCACVGVAGVTAPNEQASVTTTPPKIPYNVCFFMFISLIKVFALAYSFVSLAKASPWRHCVADRSLRKAFMLSDRIPQ